MDFGACLSRVSRAGKCLRKQKWTPAPIRSVDDFATSEGRSTSRDGLQQQLSGKKPAELKTACIEILGKVDGILSAKAPTDAAAFKTWLRQISQSVAEAATEGGFLGIGGVLVSDAEKATLAEISSALKLPG